MADKGNKGTSPYQRMVLDNTALAGTDTPYPLGFVGDLQTGLYLKSAGTLGIGANGTEIATVSGSTFTVQGFLAEGVAINLTSEGTSILGAKQLLSAQNWVSTCTVSAAGVGVILPAATSVGVGGSVCIFNDNSSKFQVYANNSETIDGVAGTTGVVLTNAKRCMYVVQASLKWVSAQLGVVSA